MSERKNSPKFNKKPGRKSDGDGAGRAACEESRRLGHADRVKRILKSRNKKRFYGRCLTNVGKCGFISFAEGFYMPNRIVNCLKICKAGILWKM